MTPHNPAEQQSQDEQMYCPTCGRDLIVGTQTSRIEPATGETSSPASVYYYITCPRGHYSGPLADSPTAAIASDRAAHTQGMPPAG